MNLLSEVERTRVNGGGRMNGMVREGFRTLRSRYPSNTENNSIKGTWLRH
ncbi:MAG: hypothetical protein IKX45_02810 [Bacteroidales bacterium]|nr:hypothetical protein [Bacteroidales bacterium]